tara:strand:+ start:7421 stop:8095 length:675 start_codon:yes stop_codon:yes gene_type:complete
MTTSQIRRWQRDAARYDQPHMRLRQVAAIINQLNAQCMLDIGCGRGQLGKLCKTVQYLGCDLVIPESSDPFEFHQCDVNATSLPNLINEFDIVTCSGMLEYVHDLPRFLNWTRNRLSPGGKLIATYFNFNHLRRRMSHAVRRPPNRHPDWANNLRLSQLAALIRDADFVVERIIPTHHAFGASPGVESTVDLPTELPGWRPWSPLLSHQFIIVASATADTPNLI